MFQKEGKIKAGVVPREGELMSVAGSMQLREDVPLVGGDALTQEKRQLVGGERAVPLEEEGLLSRERTGVSP